MSGDKDTVLVEDDDFEGEVSAELDDEGTAPPQGDAKPKPAGDERGGEGNADETADADETPEQRRERRRRTGKERREQRKQLATQDSQIIAALTETLKKQNEALTKLGGKVEQLTMGETAKARDHWLRRSKQLQAAEAKALSDGDGEDAVRLRDAYNDAVSKAHFYDQQLPSREEIESRARGGEVEANVPAGQQSADRYHETVVNNARNFMTKFSWYDPAGGDADSRLVKQLDTAVAAAGFKPYTAAYWVELETRMAAHGLDDSPDEQTDEAPKPTPPRDESGRFKGPPVAGRTDAKAGSPMIPKLLKRTMQEAGQWDNLETRKRVVDSYFANLKKNA
jgi:hypothetical protein